MNIDVSLQKLISFKSTGYAHSKLIHAVFLTVIEFNTIYLFTNLIREI